jgi:hypothetical protein
MRAAPTLLLLAACAAPDPIADGSDGPADTDATSDGPDDDPCTGTWEASFAGLPEAPVARTSWAGADGASYLLAEYGASAPDPAFALDDSGCLSLTSGVIAIDVRGTGCAGRRATIDVTDRCGTACTEVRVLDPEGVVASSRTVRSDVPERLELAPAQPFSTVVVGSLDALVCGVSLRRAPLTDAMRPEDTGSDF